jgi:hypothetical protein
MVCSNESMTCTYPTADIISISIGGSGRWGQGDEELSVMNNLVQNKGSIIQQ